MLKSARIHNNGCTLYLSKLFFREELGLSLRNIIIVLISSSALLGLFLLFIFIGITIFSEGTDPFAAVVNAGLTLAAGLGNRIFCPVHLACFCAVSLCYGLLDPLM